MDQERFQAACRRFDDMNAEDPRQVNTPTGPQPLERAHAEWLSEWVTRLDPEASEALRLAARCQHLRRWEIPRESFPPGRASYLKWRETLKKFHAEQSGAVLREIGYPEATVARVQALNRKQDFPHDPESRTLEDGLCLVFLERQFTETADKVEEPVLVGALRKCWGKMTGSARALALELHFSPREKKILEKALASEEAG